MVFDNIFHIFSLLEKNKSLTQYARLMGLILSKYGMGNYPNFLLFSLKVLVCLMNFAFELFHHIGETRITKIDFIIHDT